MRGVLQGHCISSVSSGVWDQVGAASLDRPALLLTVDKFQFTSTLEAKKFQVQQIFSSCEFTNTKKIEAILLIFQTTHHLFSKIEMNNYSADIVQNSLFFNSTKIAFFIHTSSTLLLLFLHPLPKKKLDLQWVMDALSALSSPSLLFKLKCPLPKKSMGKISTLPFASFAREL